MRNELKLILFVLPIVVMLSACMSGGDKGTKPTEEATAEATVPGMATEGTDDPQRELVLAIKEKADADIPADELFPLLKETLAKVDTDAADELIRTMNGYYNRNLIAVDEPFESAKYQLALSDQEWPFTEEQIPTIEDSQLRGLVEKLYAGGHKLETAEGFIFPIVDYGKLRSISDNASSAMHTYLEILALESDNRSNSDGGLMIDWKELGQRTLAAESYVIAFPESPERDEVEQIYVNYLARYLNGMDNTPSTDGEYFKLLPEVQTEYARMSDDHGETATGRLTREWLGVLETTGGTVKFKNDAGEPVEHPEVLAFRETLEAEARALLPGNESGAD